MFERLTRNARQVILDAAQTAVTVGDGKAGPQHLMAALAGAGDSTGARVLSSYGVPVEMLHTCLTDAHHSAGLTNDEVAALRAVGIEADEVFRRLEADLGPEALAEQSQPQPRRRGLVGGPFDRDGRKVIELSLREATALGQKRHIGTEHLLLALLRHGVPAPMAAILTEHAVTYDDAKQRVLADSSGAA